MTKIVIITLIYLWATFLVQIGIHEAGHYLFGKLTGYSILFFGMFGTVIVKDGEKLSIKHYRKAGSLGQCLMKPPQKENYPFVLITLGGCILNAITAAIAILIIMYPFHIPFVHVLGLSLFAFNGLAFAIINGIPMKKTGVINDGQVLLDLLNSSCARECYKKQLDMIPELISGKTFGEIPFCMFLVPEDAELTNCLIGYHKILECYYFMDLRDWKKAQNCLELFYDKMEKLPVMNRNIVLAEELFLQIIQGDTTVKESGIYKKIEGYLKRNSGDCNSIRVRISYDTYCNPQNTDTNKILTEIHKLSNNYIQKGEAKFCESLIKEFL